MIYPRGKKRISRLRRRLLGGLLGLSLIFLIGNWWSGGSGWASAIASPFWYVGERLAAGVDGLWSLAGDKEDLMVTNAALALRLAELEAKLVRQNLLIAENEKLRSTLGLAQPASRAIIAETITDASQSPFDTLLVAIGSHQQPAEALAPGDLVGLESGLALGRVIEVAATVSKIKLFSAPGNELPATLGAVAIPVKLIGRGLGNFIAEVPRGVVVRPGDEAVFNSGSRDWVAAVVGSIDGDNSETMQRVLLRAPLNLNQLRYVEIYHQ